MEKRRQFAVDMSRDLAITGERSCACVCVWVGVWVGVGVCGCVWVGLVCEVVCVADMC